MVVRHTATEITPAVASATNTSRVVGDYAVFDIRPVVATAENATATERENSRVLLIVAPADAKEKVMSIAKKYRETVHQESVLVVTSTGDAIFVGDDQ